VEQFHFTCWPFGTEELYPETVGQAEPNGPRLEHLRDFFLEKEKKIPSNNLVKELLKNKKS
jgi:hypothetical protein